MAEEPSLANDLYNYFVEKLRAEGAIVKCGVFGGDMKIYQENDGPVTIIYEI